MEASADTSAPISTWARNLAVVGGAIALVGTGLWLMGSLKVKVKKDRIKKGKEHIEVLHGTHLQTVVDLHRSF